MNTTLDQNHDPNRDRSQIPSNATAPEGYITKEEVAKRLKKTVRTVENWQAKGLLPYVKIGRSVLFNWSDVESHVQTNFRIVRRSPAK